MSEGGHKSMVPRDPFGRVVRQARDCFAGGAILIDSEYEAWDV